MSHSKVRVSSHCSMNCARSQMSAKLPVIRICRDCSNHVRRIDVFQCAHDKSVWIHGFYLRLVSFICLEFSLVLFPLLLCPRVTIFWDSFLEVLPDVLQLIKNLPATLRC
jgi:hypothetical protein